MSDELWYRERAQRAPQTLYEITHLHKPVDHSNDAGLTAEEEEEDGATESCDLWPESSGLSETAGDDPFGVDQCAGRLSNIDPTSCTAADGCTVVGVGTDHIEEAAQDTDYAEEEDIMADVVNQPERTSSFCSGEDFRNRTLDLEDPDECEAYSPPHGPALAHVSHTADELRNNSFEDDSTRSDER